MTDSVPVIQRTFKAFLERIAVDQGRLNLRRRVNDAQKQILVTIDQFTSLGLHKVE